MFNWIKRKLGLGGRGDFFDDGGMIAPGHLPVDGPDGEEDPELEDQIAFVKERILGQTWGNRSLTIAVQRIGQTRPAGRVDADVFLEDELSPYASFTFTVNWPFQQDRFTLRYDATTQRFTRIL
jgi:hypothetical protein